MQTSVSHYKTVGLPHYVAATAIVVGAIVFLARLPGPEERTAQRAAERSRREAERAAREAAATVERV